MICMYMVLYILTYFPFYDEGLFNILAKKVDTPMMALTTAGAIFYIRSWSRLAIISFILVILLNILTELSFRAELNYYHEIYQGIIVLGIITAIIFSDLSIKNNK